ncbi:MAG: trehalase family glycosidase [Armatimonadota bacterium]|jgi:hypothetical protein
MQLALVCLLAAGRAASDTVVLQTESFKHYIDQFNADDEELYANIPNARAWEFLRANIPLFECPDRDFERTYYFRWWTYRKHVKLTPDGYVITEFLPNVSWSGKHNTISCPAGHHFYEGRWLRDPRYLNDYAVFWFRKGGSPRLYSFWAADALYAHYLVQHDAMLIVDLLPDLVRNYEAWERARLLADGLFWQIDDRDGMEVSVGHSGKRATINSYMYGDAVAIARIARLAGDPKLAAVYDQKAARLRTLIQEKLWDDEAKFFMTLPRSELDMTHPRHSGDGSVPRLHWWDKERLGSREWVQYDFEQPVEIDSVEVYWFDDGSGIRLPETWRVLYREGEDWKPVENRAPCVVEPDRFNTMTFAPVKTAALRLEVQSQRGKCAGLFEWRVLADGANVAPSADVSCSFEVKRARWGDPRKAPNDGEGARAESALVDVRELHGYTPWYFNVPEQGKGYEVAWRQLMDPRGFHAPFGPTTAEQRHPGFRISYEGHGCQWNGPSWPLSTAVTLTALANVLNNYQQDSVTKADYYETLRIYTRSHRFEREDGRVVPWIDENLNPFTGDWIARTRMEERNAELRESGRADQILRERGKDYNHSSYCDLIITGLVGLRPRADDTVEVNPLLPEGTWDYFCLDNVLYHGHTLTILWDRTGTRYGKGSGLRVLADGTEIARSDALGRVTGQLPTNAGT